MELRDSGGQRMELDRIKACLGRVRGIEGRIEADLAEARRLRELGRQVGALGSERFASGLRDLEALEAGLEEEIDALNRCRRAVRDAISRVEPPEERTLLQLRYLCGKKWEEVAEEMGYSWQGIHKVHRRVLERLRKQPQEWMEVDAGLDV